MSVLCEMCNQKITGPSILWRRGFVASCCWGCGMELSQLAAQGLVDFAAPGAAWFIAEIVLGTTPSDRLSHWQRPSLGHGDRRSS